MKVAVALVLVSISAIVGPAATAATFDTYEEDGEEFCSLDLQGVDEMLISAEKGKGVTGEVWVEFMAERDRSFSSDMELRLEVTVGKDTTDADPIRQSSASPPGTMRTGHGTSGLARSPSTSTSR